MNQGIIKCTKCNQIDSIAYYCCNKQEYTCYSCSKIPCIRCNKKKNNVYNKSMNLGNEADISQTKSTCIFCDKTYYSNLIEFQCKHKTCGKCFSRKIQQKVKYRMWSQRFQKDKIKDLSYCNCYSKKSFDASQFVKNHCICCGQQLRRDKHILLKYGLRMRQSCSNKISLEISSQSILDKDQLNNLTKKCTACLKLIDGFNIRIGSESKTTIYCYRCNKLLQGHSGQQQSEEKEIQMMKSCAICSASLPQESMTYYDNFYLCGTCDKQSKKQQNYKISKHPEVLPHLYLDSNREGERLYESNKQDRIKQKKYDYGINLNNQIKEQQQRKSNIKENEQKNCVSCNRLVKQNDIQPQFQICYQCYGQNSPSLRKIQSQPDRRRQEQYQPFYRSIKQQNIWRKNVDYKTFIKRSELPNFKQRMKRPIKNEQQQLIKKKLSNPFILQSNNQRSVLYSVIKEIPDTDNLDILLYDQKTVNCGCCGYVLEKGDAIKYKDKEMCLGCFIIAQAKSG